MPLESDRLRRFLFESEPTYGTDAVQAVLDDETADIIYKEVSEGSLQQAVEAVSIVRRRGSMANQSSEHVPDVVNLDGFVIPLTGRKGDGEPGGVSPVMKAANFSEEISGNDVIYKIDRHQQDAMTVYEFRELTNGDARLYSTTGAKCAATISGERGQEIVLNIGEGFGRFAEPTDVRTYFDVSTGEILLDKAGSAVTARTTGVEKYDAYTPILWDGGTLKWTPDGGAENELEVVSFTIDPGMSVGGARVGTGDSTLHQAVTSRDPDGGNPTVTLTVLNSGGRLDEALASQANGSTLSAEITAQNDTEQIFIEIGGLKVQEIAPSEEDGYTARELTCEIGGDFSGLVDHENLTITMRATP